MSPYTTAEHILQGNRVLSRLNAIDEFAKKASKDSALQLQFQAKCEIASELYNKFNDNSFGLKIDEEKDRKTFDGLVEKIDDVYGNIKCFQIQLKDILKCSDANKTNVRLPKIDIPKFDGNFKNSSSFFDLFKSLIDDNKTLSDVEKFQYLLTSLVGEPLNLVKTLPLSEANYKIAFKTLSDRYYNLRFLASNYWKGIFGAPTAVESNAKSLRNLLNVITENLSALELMENLDLWDFTLFNIVFGKLDFATQNEFEIQHKTLTIPSFKDLNTFLNNRCLALETVKCLSSENKYNVDLNRKLYDSKKVASQSYSNSKQTSSFVSNTSTNNCCFCKSISHTLLKCDKFLELEPYSRYLFAKENRLCFRCLDNSRHGVKRCYSSSSCGVCKLRHHTLLHFAERNQPVKKNSEIVNPDSIPLTALSQPSTSEAGILKENKTVGSFSSTVHKNRGLVLLSTAMVAVRDSQGIYRDCRVLLDTASQASFISDKCLEMLGLEKKPLSMSIQGLNQVKTASSQGVTNCLIKPRFSGEPVIEVELIVLSSICSAMPSEKVEIRRSWKHIRDLSLADENFGHPQEIDILLGGEIVPLIFKVGRRVGGIGEPIALNSIFGWILMGKVNCDSPVISSFCSSLDLSLDSTLKKFWELENVPGGISALSDDDALCEEIFVKKHSRNDFGRYVVALPFRNSAVELGDSYNLAYRRFLSLEARLVKNSSLRNEYSAFMLDYLNSGHMSRASVPVSRLEGYFISHFCVHKSSKFRVVFNGSCPTSNGVSLNDCLLTGPKLQQDIATLMLKFRLHSFVFTTDIRQMYRNVLVVPEHRKFQRILWRFDPGDPLQEYELNTVTYGLNSSPYLAIRTLLQLARDEGNKYPLASAVLSSDIYVDDLVTGSDTLEHAQELQKQLIDLLRCGGFELRKWSSNHVSLLSTLPSDHLICKSLSFDSERNICVKVLGLQWHPSSDSFSYSVETMDRPCFLSPLTLFAKHFIQHLWTLGLDWDDVPPPDVVLRWNQYKSELPSISGFHLGRGLSPNQFVSCELHGFCDSSEIGYAAVIYFRFLLSDGQVKIFFVCARSKVAPLKRVSIPRLELCTAVLLSDLIDFVVKTYTGKLKIDRIFAWSDSTVVLAWIRSSPHRWKTFVSNRVTHIQEKTPIECWKKVSTSDNAADCASRGLMPNELLSHPLWWAGPSWLSDSSKKWPIYNDTSDFRTIIKEEERNLSLASQIEENLLDRLLMNYSSLRKIQGIVAYCFRFIVNLTPNIAKTFGPLSELELTKSLYCIAKFVQETEFKDELSKIRSRQLCSKQFRKLAPFVDEHGLCRVGGRLRHSSLDLDAKHPIILPRNHRFTELIIENFHRKYLHCGPQTLQFLIGQQFWILGCRRAINHCLSHCIRCFRVKPVALNTVMGDLPCARISRLKPFAHSGVAGPFSVTLGRHRGSKSAKAWICLFVCFATKAIHLELVSSLSGEAFLAAFRRFVARRGKVTDMYSDRGTNFVKINNLLSSFCEKAASNLSIKWHFNPPSAPHFGGLWEAGVKSVKTHLVRDVGEQILTFEEFTTVLTQIEAVLNSRPLCSMSTDPNDLNPLTPGHFLTLEPLSAPPDENLGDIKLNRLTRWQLLQRCHQDFWRRWQNEYLHTLQQRKKWHSSPVVLEIGDLVVIKHESDPPLRWTIGRIVELFHGRDGISRVAQVKTQTGLLKRPVAKLCLLPVH